MSNIIIYILVYLVIFIVGNPIVQQKFAELCKKSQADSVTGLFLSVLLGALLLGVFLLLQKNNVVSEPFLFEVSKFKPRCTGLYQGMPNSFQFDRIGCQRNAPVSQFNPDMVTNNGKTIRPYCKYEENPPLGFVPNSESDASLFGGDPKLFTDYSWTSK